jgi:8-oxo-dGTP pyrophosphatase MutT (NUDIX family)
MRLTGTAYADWMTLAIAARELLPVPVQRLGYRGAYWLLRIYWMLFRPSVTGVKCVLTDGDQVLLVRHSYGPRTWDLPGGSVKAGEEPADTARREMHEELGVAIEQWQPLGHLQIVIEHRRDCIHLFQAELHDPPLSIDRGELLAANWFSRAQLPHLGRYTRQILALTEALA